MGSERVYGIEVGGELNLEYAVRINGGEDGIGTGDPDVGKVVF